MYRAITEGGISSYLIYGKTQCGWLFKSADEEERYAVITYRLQRHSDKNKIDKGI
jgi:hypothetical protein